MTRWWLLIGGKALDTLNIRDSEQFDPKTLLPLSSLLHYTLERSIGSLMSSYCQQYLLFSFAIVRGDPPTGA